MTFRGSFSPSTETRPPMTHPAGNLLANSSQEASAFSYSSVSGCSVEWSTAQAHSGVRSTKVTLSSGTWHVQVPVSVANVPAWQATVYARASANRAIVLTCLDGASTIVDGTLGAIANTWSALMVDTAADSEDITHIRLGGTPSHGWQSGDVVYLDSFQVIGVPDPTYPLQAWRPHPAEAFYIKSDFWQIVGATDTFAGESWAAGDLITATGTPKSGYLYLDNVVWNKTEYVPSPDGPIAQLLQQRPTDDVGFPV